MKTVLYIAALIITRSNFGQNALPGNVGGKWSIMTKVDTLFLPGTVQFLSLFDSKGLASFIEFDKFGIIASSGERIHGPEFQQCRQLGNGYYEYSVNGVTRVLDFSSEDSPSYSLDQVAGDDRWFILKKDSIQLLINKSDGISKEISTNDVIINQGFGYILLKNDLGENWLYCPDNDPIEVSQEEVKFTKEYLLIESGDYKALILPHCSYRLPNDSKNIELNEFDFHYTSEGKSYIIDHLTGVCLLSVPFDKIKKEGLYYIASIGGFKGLLDLEGNVLVKPKYLYLKQQGELFYTGTSDGNGLLSSEFKEILPCKYYSITTDDRFYYVSDENGFEGLISKENVNTVLECKYDCINVSGEKIRAWLGKNMVMITLDSNEKVVQKLTLNNVISVQTRRERNKNFDSRLYSVGWFYQESEIYDSMGFNINTSIKWGLRLNMDSVLIQPRYNTPVFIPGAGFTIIPSSDIQYSFMNNPMKKYNSFGIVDFFNGNVLMPLGMLSIDTCDFLNRSFSRCFSSKGPGYITNDNKIHNVSYIDPGDSDYIRFCDAKGFEPCLKEESIAVRIPSMNVNDDPLYSESITKNNRDYSYVRYIEAKWNFLDRSGNKLIDQNFDFVQPFKYGTSIVSVNGVWGVISYDTIRIPIQFSAIKRIPEFADTVFKVTINKRKMLYFDTLGILLPIEGEQISKAQENLTQINYKGKKSLINENYNVVSGDYATQFFVNDGYFAAKANKKYYLHSPDGEEITELDLKPAEILFNEYIIVENGRKKGLITFKGDTLINADFKNIQQIGQYIFCDNGVERKLYDSNFKEILNIKKGILHIDTLSGQILINKKKKFSIINEKGEKLKKFKSNHEFIAFFNEHLFFESELSELIITKNGKEYDTLLSSYSEIIPLDEGYFLVKDKEDKEYFFNKYFRKIDSFKGLTKVKYLGNGSILASNESGNYLIKQDTFILVNHEIKPIGHYSDGLLLVADNNAFYYMNDQFENAFEMRFEDATPFRFGYATIKRMGGWTIIDKQGNLKTFPVYGELTQIGKHVFQCKANPVYGLYSSSGKKILSAEYDAINIISPFVIQAIRDGSIYYFDENGMKFTFKN